jgi:hypothetical protein
MSGVRKAGHLLFKVLINWRRGFDRQKKRKDFMNKILIRLRINPEALWM